jgi:hypothetical protein
MDLGDLNATKRNARQLRSLLSSWRGNDDSLDVAILHRRAVAEFGSPIRGLWCPWLHHATRPRGSPGGPDAQAS